MDYQEELDRLAKSLPNVMEAWTANWVMIPIDFARHESETVYAAWGFRDGRWTCLDEVRPKCQPQSKIISDLLLPL